VGVAVGGLDLEYPVTDLEDGDIEGSAAQIEDGDFALFFLIQTIGEGRRRRFVDDPPDVEAGDPPRVLGGLTLGIVEIGRNGDHRVGNLFSQVVLRRLFHLYQDHGGDLRRAVITVPHGHLGVAVGRLGDPVGADALVVLDLLGTVLSADEPLDCIYGILRIGNGLAPGYLSHQSFAAFRKCDHRGGRPVSFLICNYHRVAAFHDRHAGIGGSQVNTDYFSHDYISSLINPILVQHVPLSSGRLQTVTLAGRNNLPFNRYPFSSSSTI